MYERKIKNIESTSIGKKTDKNDDDIYIGENFVAVIDGVSYKSEINVGEKNIKIANIITEAIKKIDRPTAPDYAKTLEFEEFVKYVNMYIKKYCEHINYPIEEKPLEATGAIYSKYHNQIWIVGDCRAVYDDKTIENELKIDEVYMDIRVELIKALQKAGISQQELFSKDVTEEIIANHEKINKYIKDEKEKDRIQTYIENTMIQALEKCGFSKNEIQEKNLLEKYYNPRNLQQHIKNNPDVGEFGYSVFNGVYTEMKNCTKIDLPENVKKIKLTSDGIPINISKNNSNIGQVIRKIRKLAKNDPLSINENKAVRNATVQRDKNYALDDASEVDFEIEYIDKRDEER